MFIPILGEFEKGVGEKPPMVVMFFFFEIEIWWSFNYPSLGDQNVLGDFIGISRKISAFCGLVSYNDHCPVGWLFRSDHL